MEWTEVVDGRTITHRPMSRGTRELPTFGLWRWFMSSRPDHGEVTDTDDVLFTCIGCGIKLPKLMLTDIRIGALVRQDVEEQVTATEWEQFTKVIPAQRKGNGCPACASLYFDECNAIAKFNENEQKIYSLSLELAKAEGKPTTEIKIPTLRMAWVDIQTQVKEQRDGYMQHLEQRRSMGITNRELTTAPARAVETDQPTGKGKNFSGVRIMQAMLSETLALNLPRLRWHVPMTLDTYAEPEEIGKAFATAAHIANQIAAWQ